MRGCNVHVGPYNSVIQCYFVAASGGVRDQAVQQDLFTAVRLVHSLLKILFLNFSCDIEFKFTLCYQIYEFDINIQILVWIIGSTYRKGEILKQK